VFGEIGFLPILASRLYLAYLLQLARQAVYGKMAKKKGRIAGTGPFFSQNSAVPFV
jgi:hypothetical protein